MPNVVEDEDSARQMNSFKHDNQYNDPKVSFFVDVDETAAQHWLLLSARAGGFRPNGGIFGDL